MWPSILYFGHLHIELSILKLASTTFTSMAHFAEVTCFENGIYSWAGHGSNQYRLIQGYIKRMLASWMSCPIDVVLEWSQWYPCYNECLRYCSTEAILLWSVDRDFIQFLFSSRSGPTSLSSWPVWLLPCNMPLVSNQNKVYLNLKLNLWIAINIYECP